MITKVQIKHITYRDLNSSCTVSAFLCTNGSKFMNMISPYFGKENSDIRLNKCLSKELTALFGSPNKVCRNFENKPSLWILERNGVYLHVYSSPSLGTTYELLINENMIGITPYKFQEEMITRIYAEAIYEFIDELFHLIFK